MLYISINDMRTGIVEFEDRDAVASEVAVTATELDMCFNEADGQYYECNGSRELYVLAIINPDTGDADYAVSDYSFFCGGADGFTIYEAYNSPAEYRNSAYEHIIALADSCVRAYDRLYCSDFGRLPDTDDVGSGEHCCRGCTGCQFIEHEGNLD